MNRLPLRSEFAGEEPYGAPQLDVPVRLNVNENPFAPPRELIEAISAAATQAGAELNRYPDRDFRLLREALARYLNEESGVSLEPENIWAANGSNEVISHLMTAFAGPGRTVLSFPPTYSMYPEYVRNCFAEYAVVARTEDYLIDMEAARAALARVNPALVLVASPNNPTGTMLSLDTLGELARAAETTGPGGSASLIVIDEAYGEFRRDGVPSALELLEAHPNVAVIRTMSKAFGAAGLRLGYMAASRAIIDAATIVRLPYHLSSLTQTVACAALAHTGALREQVEFLRSARDTLAEDLRSAGFTVIDSDANFLLFGTFADRHATWRELLNHGILIREVGPEGFLRVSIGTESENAAFLAALKEVTHG